MKKEHILELMNTVPADLIEEADIQCPAKRRFPRAVRTGLIAACLCLALLGTAFAAANPEAVADFIHRFTPVQAEPATQWDGAEGYQISYEPTRFPIGSFSPALLASNENELYFDTWKEVCAFIGQDIPCFLPDAIKNRDGQFEVFLNYDQDHQLVSVMVCTFGSAPWAQIYIATEHYDALDDAGLAHSATYGGPGSTSEVLSPYTMVNGCQAQITLLTHPAGPDEDPDTINNTFCYGTFVLNGIEYSVSTYGCRYPEDELLAPLYTVLDSFS